MTIARIGNYALKTRNYIGEHTYTTHDIELVKYELVDKSKYSDPESVNDEYCYSIAEFTDDGDVKSFGTRLIDAIYEDNSSESVEAVNELISVGIKIVNNTTKVESGYIPNNSSKCWRYNSETGLLDEVKEDE